MSNDHFRKLRQLLMEKLDLARELSDQEILEQIDDLILNGMRESALSLKEKVQLRRPFLPADGRMWTFQPPDRLPDKA